MHQAGYTSRSLERSPQSGKKGCLVDENPLSRKNHIASQLVTRPLNRFVHFRKPLLISQMAPFIIIANFTQEVSGKIAVNIGKYPASSLYSGSNQFSLLTRSQRALERTLTPPYSDSHYPVYIPFPNNPPSQQRGITEHSHEFQVLVYRETSIEAAHRKQR